MRQPSALLFVGLVLQLSAVHGEKFALEPFCQDPGNGARGSAPSEAIKPHVAPFFAALQGSQGEPFTTDAKEAHRRTSRGPSRSISFALEPFCEDARDGGTGSFLEPPVTGFTFNFLVGFRI